MENEAVVLYHMIYKKRLITETVPFCCYINIYTGIKWLSKYIKLYYNIDNIHICMYSKTVLIKSVRNPYWKYTVVNENMLCFLNDYCK